MKELIVIQEHLQPEEIAFIRKQANRQTGYFYRIFKIIIIISFVFPFAMAWYQAADGDEHAFSFVRYFACVFIFLFISCISMYLFYKFNLGKLYADLRDRTKLIESTQVKRKQYMPQNNAYYLYLTSPTRLSIEVEEDDFRKWEAGDEVNIEYSQHAHLYFGYF